MPVSPRPRSVRGIIAALTVAILGVLALDATAIVAAPKAPSAGSAAPAATQDTSHRLRLLLWSGQVWLVLPNNQTGPDQDPLSDSDSSVHVDSTGRLHLTVRKVGGVWRSVQLESLAQVNYGSYRFVTRTSSSTLAKPLDFGMFVYRAGSPYLTNEIDLENSRALIGMHGHLDAQFVVQPYYKPHHIRRYVISHGTTATQQQFVWAKGDVRFATRRGTAATAPVVERFHYHGSSTPTPYGEHVYVNLFIHGGGNKVGPGTRTAVIDSFTYTPPT
jgi:hypothetical protein